jgi:hypothetical protein
MCGRFLVAQGMPVHHRLHRLLSPGPTTCLNRCAVGMLSCHDFNMLTVACAFVHGDNGLVRQPLFLCTLAACPGCPYRCPFYCVVLLCASRCAHTCTSHTSFLAYNFRIQSFFLLHLFLPSNYIQFISFFKSPYLASAIARTGRPVLPLDLHPVVSTSGGPGDPTHTHPQLYACTTSRLNDMQLALD